MSLAAYPTMMRRSRERLGLRECRAAWLLGLTVREYRAVEAGNAGIASDTWEQITEVFGWPVSSSRRDVRAAPYRSPMEDFMYEVPITDRMVTEECAVGRAREEAARSGLHVEGDPVVTREPIENPMHGPKLAYRVRFKASRPRA